MILFFSLSVTASSLIWGYFVVLVCGSLVTVHAILSALFVLLNKIVSLLPTALTRVCNKNAHIVCGACIAWMLLCDDQSNILFIYYKVIANDECDISNIRNVWYYCLMWIVSVYVYVWIMKVFWLKYRVCCVSNVGECAHICFLNMPHAMAVYASRPSYTCTLSLQYFPLLPVP
jgi:hypothetical protein